MKRSSVLLVTALTMIGVAGITAPAQSKVPGPNGQILFTRFDPALGDGVLYTVNPDGSHPRQVLPIAIECPNWSPDGTRIATCGSPDGAASRIINPDTGTYREVFAADPTLNLACPVWSPDAKRLACDQFAVPDNPNRAGLYTIRSSDGGGLRRITKNPGGEDDPVDYSPNGTQIVFMRADPTRPANANHAIFVVNVDGTGVHRISPWGSRGLGINAGWSPDGQTIVYSDNGSLYRTNPDGTGRVNIPLAISGFSFAFDPGWSPDGTKIVFGLFTQTSTASTAQEGIYTANADGSGLEQVTNSPTHDDSQDWGPHPLAT